MGGLLLLDVDGPLNPYMARPTKRPPGYQTYRYVRRTDQLVGGPRARKTKGLRVWLNPAHGPQLLAFAAETGMTLVWATKWEHQANRLVAPAIGLEFEAGRMGVPTLLCHVDPTKGLLPEHFDQVRVWLAT